MQVRQAGRISTRRGDQLKDRPEGAVFQRTTECLWPYPHFAATITIGVHSKSLPVGSRAGKTDRHVVCCGISLPEAFSTCRSDVHLFCRLRLQ